MDEEIRKKILRKSSAASDGRGRTKLCHCQSLSRIVIDANVVGAEQRPSEKSVVGSSKIQLVARTAIS
jgi:hypothetical protein